MTPQEVVVMNDDALSVADRFATVGAADGRFINVQDGGKASHDHDTRYPSPVEVPGQNYGIYADPDDAVVLLDVDDYDDLADDSGLAAVNELRETLTQTSAHGGEHRIYLVETDGDAAPAAVLEDEFGTQNPNPSWGEVRAANQYVVGAGSQLDGCDKDWCNACADPDGGWYSLATDHAIAVIDATALVTALRQDPDLSADDDESATTSATTTASADDMSAAERLEVALNDSDDDTLQRLWKGNYGAYGDDRSEAESALAARLGFWLGGLASGAALEREAERVLDGGVSVPGWGSPNLQKWPERQDRSYRDSVLEAVHLPSEHYDPSGPSTPSPEELIAEYSDTADAPDTADDAPSTTDDDDDALPDAGLTWDDVRAAYQAAGEEDGVTKGDARKRAQTVLERAHDWMFVVESERLWVYDEASGTFNRWGEAKLRELLVTHLDRHYSQTELREIRSRLESANTAHRETLNARDRDDALLCVGNGVVNLDTGERYEHSPAYRFVRGLEWEYGTDKPVDTAAVLSFLDDITQREADRDTLLDHLAHGLMPGHPYRAFVVCYGPGGNGKTQVAELFRRFVGEDNAANVEIDELVNDDFASGDLPGKFINWGDDMSGDGGGSLTDLSTLKKASGGSYIRANEKYEKTFNFKNEAALFFSANEPPRIGETKRSIKDRLYPIRMPYVFEADPNPDDPMSKPKTPNIAAELAEDDAVMRGLLELAVEHAQELRERNGEYAMPEGPDERFEKYNAEADPIVRFTQTGIKEASDAYRIRKDDAYRVYRSFCDLWNERESSEDGFKRQLPRAVGHDVETKQSRKLATADDEADRVRCWNRLQWTSAAEDVMPDWMVDRYQDHFTADDDDDAPATTTETDVATSIATVEAGYATVELTVETTMEPKPWLNGEGVLRDAHDTPIDYVIRSSGEAPDLKEGVTYRFTDVVVQPDETPTRVEIRPGTTTVTVVSETTDGGQNDLRDGAAAATDGGTAAGDSFAELAADVVKAIDRRPGTDSLPRGELVQTVLTNTDAEEPDRVSAAIDRALERGDLVELPGGELSSSS